MKIIENLTLNVSMSGAWDGDNVLVIAKLWDGKISKEGKLTAGFTVNEIAVDPDMVNSTKQTATATVTITRSIDRKDQKKTINYVNLAGTSHITQAVWNLVYGNRSGWSSKTLGFGEYVDITVPKSTYNNYDTFRITASGVSGIRFDTSHGSFPKMANFYVKGANNTETGAFVLNTTAIVNAAYEGLDIGSYDGHSNFPYERTVYIFDKNKQAISGALSCTTQKEANYGWTSAVGQSGGTWYNQNVKAGSSIKIYVPSSKPFSGSTYFTVHGTSSGGSGGGGGSCCFPAGAPVLLANGSTAPIESLTLGTAVIGYDLDRQEFCDTEVMSTIQKKHRSDIYEIQREDGVSFLMTANHVVLTKNGWKAIDAERGQQAVPDEVVTELTSEDELLRSDGNYIKINNIRYRDDLQDQNVYNIDVEEVDTYIVYDIVVHNECSGGNE